MKKNLLLFSLLCTVLSYGQFTLGEDSVHEAYTTSEPDVAVHNTYQTDAPPKTISWDILSIEVPSTWDNDISVCDAETCFDTTYNSNTYTLTDNKQYALDVHFINNNNVGFGLAKLRIWEEGDSAATVKVVTYTTNITEPVGVRDLNVVKISVFPNPASSTLVINNSNSSIDFKSLTVYNIIGKELMVINNPKDKETIDVKGFENGVYIIRLTSTDEKYYSQSFIKN